MIKVIISEQEMEKILEQQGYDIMDSIGDDACTDSTKVIDYAIELGYRSNMDEDTGYITFTKDEEMKEKYQCMVCGKFIANDEGITTLSGLWVCDNDSCRTLDDDNEATETQERRF